MADMNLKRNFGMRLKYLRLKRGMTQEALADKLSVAAHYISDIECGHRNITIDTVERITLALQVDPKSLFNFDE